MPRGSRSRILILLILIGFAIFGIGRLFGASSGPSIAQGSTLLIEIGGQYVEAPAASPFARLMGDTTRPFLGLLSTFRKAERDPRIEAVVLRIEPVQIGWGKADELRAAIERLRAAGKRTVAYLEVAGFQANHELYVASAADEVYVAPGSALPMVGLAAEYLFLGGLMEKIGVDFDVAKAGRYKSAVETYANRSMSEASREMADSLLDDTFRRFVRGIAEGRKLTTAAVAEAIDAGAVRSQRLEALGLIDGERHLDELLRDREPIVEHADYRRVDADDLGIEAQGRFALIYGSGMVLQGEASDSPISTGPSFASETVSDAIRAAVEDDSIQAIVIRIDSPGGSALASELIWNALRRAREEGKPVIASFSDVAASGGYYVAAAADSIVADPGTLTGSIGVFAIRPVIGGMLEKLEIGIDSLTRGKHADFLLSSQNLSPAAMARLQTSVMDTYQLFLTRVADARGLTLEEVDAVGQGRVWTGAQALEAGLVDELGGIYTAVRRAKEATGLDPEADVFLVPFPKQKTLGEQVLETLQQSVARAAAPRVLWPAPLAGWLERMASLPPQTPLLIPPVWLEIH